MPTAAFGKDYLLGKQIHAWHILICFLAIFANTHIASANTDNLTIIIGDDMGSRKARIDLNTHRFGLFC